MRQAGGERRPVVERPDGLAQGLLDRLLEDAILLPPLEDLLLLLRERDAVGHCHQAMRVQRVCRCGRGCDGSAPSVKDMLHGRGKRRGERRRACFGLSSQGRQTTSLGRTDLNSNTGEEGESPVITSPQDTCLDYLLVRLSSVAVAVTPCSAPPCGGRHHELDGSGEVRDGPHRQAVPDDQPGQALLHVSSSSSHQRRPACVIACVRAGRYYNSWHQCKYDHSDEEPQCQKLRQWSMSMCPTLWVRLSYHQPPPLRRVTATTISASPHPRHRPRRSHARSRHRSTPLPPSP